MFDQRYESLVVLGCYNKFKAEFDHVDTDNNIIS